MHGGAPISCRASQHIHVLRSTMRTPDALYSLCTLYYITWHNDSALAVNSWINL